MKNAQLSLLFLVVVLFYTHHVQSQPVPELGVCISIDNANIVKKYGYGFIQPTVQDALQPFKDDSLFNDNKVKKSPVNVSVVNVFIPGSLKTTGPDVDVEAVLDYASVVFKRAQDLNIPLIVFGSGASRHIPDGFDRDRAFSQFVDISKKLAFLASEHNVILALESQNKEECNFLNTLKECIDVALAVDHPNFGITVDIYHMMRENEPISVIKEGADYIYHCDLGEMANRTAPGVAGDDFVPLFKIFQEIGYEGKIALECRFNDLETELPLAKRTIEEQWNTALAQ